jgi:hypothetical protein
MRSNALWRFRRGSGKRAPEYARIAASSFGSAFTSVMWSCEAVISSETA